MFGLLNDEINSYTIQYIIMINAIMFIGYNNKMFLIPLNRIKIAPLSVACKLGIYDGFNCLNRSNNIYVVKFIQELL
jgi:hypothetical protein